ncbi:MAG TPA: D-amino acid aminotransferase [Chloroflexota bacterium]|nr:D-amino acid aminotransferase [Chloroflexota bacterium]
MPDTLVYLNGQFVPYDDAKIPVEDRSVQFADGVYEVVRYYNGQPFRMAQHLARLTRSAAGIEIPLPPVEELRRAMDSLIERQGLTEATVYLQVTRGVAARQHGLVENLAPTVIAIARPAKSVRPRPTLKVVTYSDDRWARCYIKTTQLLPNALARERAKRLGADDAIFLRDGFVMEASAANVFIVKNEDLLTPPLTNYILPGITREVIVELAEQVGVPVREEPITQQQLYTADEVFITGTNSELGPVVEVDGRKVGDGKIGPIFARLLAAFDAAARSQEPLPVHLG